MPSLDRAGIDADADRVVRKLTRAGYKAYLVGGCVRDLLVGRTPKDFDVATSATPNEIKATFRNSRIIGRRFRLAHVFFGAKIIETATFRANPRDEDDHDLLIRRDNVFGSESEDAKRRDFTINGLFYDVEREEVIDHVGGLADLDAKLVRTIGDPDIRFQEDPVRMLRAIKFAARLDFGFEPATWRALLRWRSEISKCAPPRLLEEVHRLLRGGASRRSFELLVETGVLAVLSPYLAGLLEGTGAPATAPPTIAAVPHPTVARLEYDDEDPAEHDPDDPDEEPETAAVEAATADELDSEEREWHRVWADDPPARAAHAASVKMSFLSPAELAQRRAVVWAALEALDNTVKAGRDPSNAVALGAVIGPFLYFEAEPRGNVLQAAISELSEPLIHQLHVTRRDSERLRYLLVAQRRMAAAKKKGTQAELAGGRDLIEDAVVLYTLLDRATGGDAALGVPEIAATEGSGPIEAGDDDDPNAPRKRRRRRRGGRRRRAEL
ncbi:MAG TPA: polynucleotide adenylyltransferase PcnB [Kofleriaceae bacterium]|jgi:poly(A) polymerase|nr:polynucleotide adenylyltransferase PcnB [Kofleriaceae bacterium]